MLHIICLAGAFILNGMSFSGSSWGLGEILCALAGLLYGFNIAGTGVFAKKLNVPLYLATQAVIGFVVSFIFGIILHFVHIPTEAGVMAPFEKIMFSLNPIHLILLIIFVLVVSAVCWIIRTHAMKHIDASIVAIIMPFSAVITSILSVLSGTDTLDFNLMLGGFLGLLAIFLSSAEDIFKKKI